MVSYTGNQRIPMKAAKPIIIYFLYGIFKSVEFVFYCMAISSSYGWMNVTDILDRMRCDVRHDGFLLQHPIKYVFRLSKQQMIVREQEFRSGESLAWVLPS